MKLSTSRHLQTLFDVGTAAGMPDGLLLERFVTRRDGPAFEAIVARHGPMVLSVCRRMLPEHSDVEDAFQATFLILVRKAGTLRDRHRLGPWLYGVAHRVASRARAQAARRRSRERPGSSEAAVAESSADVERRELLAVLDDEVARLPEKVSGGNRALRPGGPYARGGGAATGLCLGHRQEPPDLGPQSAPPPPHPPRPRACGGGAGRRSRTGSPSAAVPAASPGFDSQCRVARHRRSSGGRRGGLGVGLDPYRRSTHDHVPVAAQDDRRDPPGGRHLRGRPGSASPSRRAAARYDEQIEQLELADTIVEARRQDRAQAEKRLQDRTAAQLEKLGATIEREVVTVNLVATKVTDDDLRSLSAFPNLRTLASPPHRASSDAGLANLKGLKSLTTLDLFDTRVTDAGLEHLAEWMPRLEWLELYDTRITDAGPAILEGLEAPSAAGRPQDESHRRRR